MFLHNKIHVITPEGSAGEFRHGLPDGDQPAGVEIIHVGRLVSAALEARDGLTACSPPVSRLSPLSAAAPASLLSLGGARTRLQQAGDDTLYLVELAAKPGIQLHPSVDR